MNIALTKTQIRQIKQAVRDGLSAFERPIPKNLADWADENFYLSSESSYIEGRWETMPFQLAPMNAIAHPDIPQVNIVKSARVGYSQMLRAALGYFAEHKKRNQIIYQPTDGQASGFMKAHIETMIRDVPVVKTIAPWHGKKHRDNTLDTKRFSNGKQLWCLGGAAAKNYREKSPDNVYYDELAAFEDDVEKEGSPTFLGDKRIEGSAFPKSVRGSTPKNAGTCQITKAAEEAECYFRFHLPCPECQQEQVLKWGGKDCEFGIKWIDDDPKTAKYKCEHCGELIDNNSLYSMQQDGVWRCVNTGMYTTDGISFFDAKERQTEPPESVAFHVWTAYSLFTTWTKIVSDFLKAHKDRSKLKTFTNTTLGEVWEEDQGEKLEHENLYSRREHYKSEIPVENCVVTCAIDVQDDRFEVEHVAWVSGEESYRLAYKRLFGDLSRSQIWNNLKKHVNRDFKNSRGEIINARIIVIDSGGHYTDEVMQWCKKNGPQKFIPLKGHNQMGKPVAMYPRKKNRKGVYLTMVGTDTAKEIITDRLKQLEPGEGYMHYPISQQFDEDYFKHLTNERKLIKFVKGRRTIVWDSGGRRNEPLDTSVYNLSAIRILQQHFSVVLPKPFNDAEENPAEKKKKKKPSSGNDFIKDYENWI